MIWTEAKKSLDRWGKEHLNQAEDKKDENTEQ